METTGGDASWINGNNERQNRSIQHMEISGLLDRNQHENKWCYTVDTPADFHRLRIYSALDDISTHFSWYGENLSSMNLEHLDVIHNPSHHVLKS